LIIIIVINCSKSGGFEQRDKERNSVYYGHPMDGKQTQYPATIIDGIKADGGEILKNRFNYKEGN